MENRLDDPASAASGLTSAKSVRFLEGATTSALYAKKGRVRILVAPHRTELARPTIGAYIGETIVVPLEKKAAGRLCDSGDVNTNLGMARPSQGIRNYIDAKPDDPK